MNFHPRTRREVFRLGGGALALTAWPGQSGPAASGREMARGVVFEDRSGGGVRQKGDPGIPGVLVSNGRDVVKTNAMGNYELPIESGSAIFVIKPSGWMTPLDPATNLPRFYRMHQPEGSPASLGLRYPGVEPTGPLPASLDFPLRRTSESARFDVLMLADPQPADLAELDYFRESFLGALATTDAAFGITLGDVMSDNLDLYDRYNRMLGQLGLPWWNTPGNHDLNYEASDRHFARETWKRIFGPPWFAFEYGEATFIMLDNVDWRRTPSGAASYCGGIGDVQLDFVRNLLAQTPEDRLVVLCMHIPLVSSEAGARGSNTADGAQLLELLGDRPCVSFSGHMHTAEHHYIAAPTGARAPHHHQVLTAVSGSWWSGPFGVDGLPIAQCSDGAPNGYYVLSIDGARCSTRFVSRESTPMRVMFDMPDTVAGEEQRPARGVTCLSLDETRQARVLVNIFDGGPRCTATMTIPGREAITMRRVAQPDPFTRDLYARNSGSIKAWVAAGDSSHLWSARLPGLPPGFHRLRIDARDEFGRRHSQTLVFEVEAA